MNISGRLKVGASSLIDTRNYSSIDRYIVHAYPGKYARVSEGIWERTPPTSVGFTHVAQ